MKQAKVLTVISSAAVSAATLTGPPAMAVPPEVFLDVTFADEFTIPAGEVCAFAIEATSTGRIVHRHYVNQDGDIERHQTWVSGMDTATNPVSGKALEGNFSSSNFQREHEGELGPIAVNGLAFRFTVPGSGVVLIDAGRVIFDPESGDVLSVSGPHQELDGDHEAFCDALG